MDVIKVGITKYVYVIYLFLFEKFDIQVFKIIVIKFNSFINIYFK